MNLKLIDDLTHIKKQFIELKNSKKEIWVHILVGKYEGSIIKATNISIDNLSVQTISPLDKNKLSYKFYEINFIDNADYTTFCVSANTKKSNILVDKLKNKIEVGDFIIFSNSIFKKSDNIQFAEILEINSNKKVLIKTIPLIAGEKSFTLRLRYKRNFLKLSKEQINNLLINRLSE